MAKKRWEKKKQNVLCISPDDLVEVAAKAANAVVIKRAATARIKLTKEAEIRASLEASSQNRKNALQNNHACTSRTGSNYGRYC